MSIKKIILYLLTLIFAVTPIVTAIADPNLDNNIKNFSVNVIDTRELRVDFVAIDQRLSTFNNTLKNNVEFINKTYPVSDSNLIVNDNKNLVNAKIGPTLDWWEEPFLVRRLYREGRVSNKTNRVVGIVPEGWFASHGVTDGTTGYTYISYKNDSLNRASVKGIITEEGFRHNSAHELAHTFGVCDEYNNITWRDQDTRFLLGSGYCPNGDIGNNNVLDPSCLDGPRGCDTSTMGKLIPWNLSNDSVDIFNFMGLSTFQNQRWIDNLTFTQLLNQLSGTTNTFSSNNSILVSGEIYKNGTVVLDNFYILNEQIIENETSSGSYSINLESDNSIFFNMSFEADFIITKIGGNTTEANVTPFAFVVPYSNNVTKIQIKENETTIRGERNKTLNTPSLNLTFPLGNELIYNKMNITYNGTDADGDIINYAVLISSDNGNTYSTLEIDYLNKTLFVNTSGFTESKQYKVKVLATDGINTNTTISQGVFEIDNDLRIENLSVRLENDTRRVFFHKTKNTLEDRISNITETFDTGESIISLNQNYSLNASQEMFVFIEYNYTSRGDKTITSTASSGEFVETESTSINLPDIEVFNLSILNITNITKIVFRFKINNTLSVNMTNVSWNFDTNNSNIINSTLIFVLEPSKIAFVYMHYNFTTTGTFNVNATARNGTLSDSMNLTITI